MALYLNMDTFLEENEKMYQDKTVPKRGFILFSLFYLLDF